MKNYESTYDMLNDRLILHKDTDEPIILIRDNKILTYMAGYRMCGFVFAIYKDDDNYCAHVTNPDDEWLENEPPLFGYYNVDLTWNELLHEIANKYDVMSNSISK